MAENISEIRPPEPPPKSPDVPKPTERPNDSEAQAGRVPESPQSAQQDARDAARSEHAKAIGSREQDGPRLEHEVQTQPAEPPGEQAGEQAAARQAATAELAEAVGGTSTPGEVGAVRQPADQNETQVLDPADDLRDQQQATPPDSTETDESAETAARLDELRAQGHGPQRHHDPTDVQLAERLGEPVLNQQTGEPVLKDNGHVRAQNQLDPMTGTAVDGVHGGVHRCGDYATRFNSPEDYVAADRFMRQQIGDTGPAQARRPISEVLDSTAHGRMTGYYHDPDAAGELKPVDFSGGTIFALYERLPNGDLKLRTMYADPAPGNPDQSGGTG